MQGPHLNQGYCPVGSSTGAVHLSYANVGVPRPVVLPRKGCVEDEGKIRLNAILMYRYELQNQDLSIF